MKNERLAATHPGRLRSPLLQMCVCGLRGQYARAPAPCLDIGCFRSAWLRLVMDIGARIAARGPSRGDCRPSCAFAVMLGQFTLAHARASHRFISRTVSSVKGRGRKIVRN